MKVRMLLAAALYGFDLQPNMVPSLPPEEVVALQEVGAADPNPDAVAYAESLEVPLPDGFPNYVDKPTKPARPGTPTEAT